MANNRGKVDQLHDLLPKHFNSKHNINWKAIIEAMGGVDQQTADLVAEVRKQFFIKTASRPYLDRLGANNKISRPRFVGMDDSSFKQYIPVLSYKPKQVKLIIDQLLDIFFFKESTTAYINSQNSSPFTLQDGWELEYAVDEVYQERITFTLNDFTNIALATADEVVAAINRQTKYSYATSYYDSITKNTYIKIFTNTIGSKGSIRITGGRANIAFRFNGFIDASGNGSNTQWTVTKVGDLTTFEHTAGTSPNISNLQVGDIIISNLVNNQGSFVIKEVNIAENKISFTNLFSTVGVYTQTSDTDVKFVRPQKYVSYTNSRRAITWETSPGKITVEMPTSPPVVKRSLKGSWHVNGAFSNMTNRVDDTTLTVQDANTFPESGSFFLEEIQQNTRRILTPTENTVITSTNNTRLQYRNQKYTYTSRLVLATTGDIAIGSTQILNTASTVGVLPGQSVVAEGIPGYARVVSVVGPIVNITVPATATVNAQAVKFLGNTLSGITPDLPEASALNEFSLSSLSRSSSIVTATTTAPHSYEVGDYVVIGNSSGIDVTTKTGDTTSGSNILTNMSGISMISPGMLVRGTGVDTGSKVTDIAALTVTMSKQAISTNLGSVLTFSEDLNGTYEILSVTSNTFTFKALGSNGTAVTPGDSRVEKVGIANSGSKVILTTAVPDDVSRITGSYVWDLAAPFVLSSNRGELQTEIKAGKIVKLLNVGPNTIPAESGFLIFDYGLNTQEGPVRYLYKPTDNTIALDPSYVFQKSHAIGSYTVALRTKGPHVMDTRAGEYGPYITNPSEARFILQDLIKSVKSAGIFVDFLIRFPEQIYGVYDVYQKDGV